MRRPLAPIVKDLRVGHVYAAAEPSDFFTREARIREHLCELVANDVRMRWAEIARSIDGSKGMPLR